MRGGSYDLFLNLITVLVLEDVTPRSSGSGTNADGDRGDGLLADDNHEVVSDVPLKDENPAALAKLLDGHGADGHTLAHWCAKRG